MLCESPATVTLSIALAQRQQSKVAAFPSDTLQLRASSAWPEGLMPAAFARVRLRGKSSSLTDWLGFTPAPVLTLGSPLAHLTLALVAHGQGGLTLRSEEGEPGAEKYSLGTYPQINVLEV